MQKKIVFISIFLCLWLVGSVLYQLGTLFDNNLHVIFCDVGQGDGIVIRTPSRSLIVLDGGPDKKILGCLDRHLPFWERTVHLLLLSHPHEDHFLGLIPVIDRYTVRTFATENLDNPTPAFSFFKAVVQKKAIPTRYLEQGNTIRTPDGVMLHILGPSKKFLIQTSPQGTIGETKEFGSLVVRLEYGKTSVLFTGDSQVLGIDDALSGYFDRVNVLQVPHHGSRFGLEDRLVQKLLPQAAIISVGKNNYGHPSAEILSLFSKHATSLFRTDKQGDVELVISPETLSIKTQK